MIHVQSMYISPVKSLSLMPLERAFLDKPGIAGDRAFFIIDAEGALFTQRVFGPMVQVEAAYDATSARLELAFPDGSTVAGVPEPGDTISASFFGRRDVAGRLVPGEWNEAVSAFAGQALRRAMNRASGTAGATQNPMPRFSLTSMKRNVVLASSVGIRSISRGTLGMSLMNGPYWIRWMIFLFLIQWFLTEVQPE